MQGLFCLAAAIVFGITIMGCAGTSDRQAPKTQTNISGPNTNDAAPATAVASERDADDAAVENRAARPSNVGNVDQKRLDRDDKRVNSNSRNANSPDSRRDADDSGKRYEDDDDGR